MSALADALVAAQRRALAAAEKHFVADRITPEELTDLLDSMGLTDAVDRERLIAALTAIRTYGASVPAEPPNGAEKPPETATGAQVTFIQDLLKRGEHGMLAEADLKALTRERASTLIEQLKAGTYNPTEWDVPF